MAPGHLRPRPREHVWLCPAAPRAAYLNKTLQLDHKWHAGLEFLLLAILLMFPATSVATTPKEWKGEAMLDGRACRLILFAIVSVYFWSGIQNALPWLLPQW